MQNSCALDWLERDWIIWNRFAKRQYIDQFSGFYLTNFPKGNEISMLTLCCANQAQLVWFWGA